MLNRMTRKNVYVAVQEIDDDDANGICTSRNFAMIQGGGGMKRYTIDAVVGRGEQKKDQ